MKKIFLLFLYFSFLGVNLQAQVNQKHQFGVNTYPLIEKFFAQSKLFPINEINLIKETRPFHLIYKYRSHKNAFRAAAGYLHIKDGGTISVTELQYNIQLGWERFLPLSKRWSAFIGLGVGYYKTSREVENGLDLATSNDLLKEWNAGPVYGFHFQIIPSLSLSIESSMLLSYHTALTERFVTQGLEEIVTIKESSSQFQYITQTPLALFFNIHF